MVGEVPSDMAAQYTSVYWWAKKSLHYLHSYRWSAVSAVADAGATSDQMQYFFGWSNAKMNTEYISTSKAAIIKVVQKHQDAESKDNLVPVNVEKACKKSSNLANESPETVQEVWDDFEPNLSADSISAWSDQGLVMCLLSFWTNRNCMAITYLSSSLSN